MTMIKIGRNDPCPCGSGNKYKRCCWLQQETETAKAPSTDSSITKAIQSAVQHHNARRLDQAESIYQQILQAEPNHPDALHLLGVIAHQSGKNEIAVDLISKAIGVCPSASMYYNLGNALQSQGRIDEAVECYRKALLFDSKYYKAHGNLGNALLAQGMLEEAVESYRRALIINPDVAEVLCDLGNALCIQGKFSEALESYQKAILIKPDFANAYSNMGDALQGKGRLEEAVECYKLAISIKPDFAEAYSNLGSALKAKGNLDEAIVCHRQALSCKPGYVKALSSLGNALQEQGKLEEAIACYRQALILMPGYAVGYSNLLLAMQYLDTATPLDVFNEHLSYAETHESLHKLHWHKDWNIGEPDRRIKLGYVSPDFRTHSVAYFIETVIRNHDRSKFEIFLYFNSVQEDGMTLRFKSLVDHWLPCKGMTDAKLAEKIRSDEIDILVDLAGHTADNRLPVFARKPAPVQVTYLGYPNTTGLMAIDYRLTDIYADPPGVGDSLHTEKLVRLPQSFLCFTPPQDAPEVKVLPAISNGFVTFGSFNTFPKINRSVISLWARILFAVPDAKMLIKTAGLDQTGMRTHLLALFAQHGISERRLTLLAKDADVKQHLSRYNEVDICLDPFPYNGTATTCEALWMGVPTITLQGDRHSSRVGASLLSNVGLFELIAKSQNEYLEIAVRLAHETGRLATLRSGLRRRMENSPLLDGAGLTRAIENSYNKMWSVWLVES